MFLSVNLIRFYKLLAWDVSKRHQNLARNILIIYDTLHIL